jgi:hypothetical protein
LAAGQQLPKFRILDTCLLQRRVSRLLVGRGLRLRNFGNFIRDQRFESTFLQRRVGCELGPTSCMSPIRRADARCQADAFRT